MYSKNNLNKHTWYGITCNSILTMARIETFTICFMYARDTLHPMTSRISRSLAYIVPF